VTVLEVIQKGTEFLGKKGVESPRLQAESLLAHLLKLPRMELYLNFERVLTNAEVNNLRELIQRRGRREPLQHIVGSTSFCGLELVVNRHVLVPRPETEILAEQGWQFLNQLSPSHIHQATALDFGTGSGCVAIALAARCPTAQVWAVDISAKALELARENSERHNLADRIHLWRGDGLAALRQEMRFDLIISNPPYISGAEIESLQIEVRGFDPHRALDGGPDGLDYFRQLAAAAPAFLKTGGRVMLEFGDGQADEVCAIFKSQKWIVEALMEDYSHRPRVLAVRRD
jgi:release factor glutamine methyltransferase